MEHVNCFLCNTDNTVTLFGKKDKLGVTQEEFLVKKCVSCGLIYVDPRPAEREMGASYPDYYSWKEEDGRQNLMKKLEKAYRYQLLDYEAGKVLRYAKEGSGKILDIGCGTGDRLDIFRKKGFETYGVEISSSARYAKEKLGLNVIEGDLFNAGFETGRFDVVTLYNVLEHVHDPRRVLQETHRVLKDGGFLVIQVPNTGSSQFRLFGKRWAAVDVPRHLYYFNELLLERLLREEKFRVTKVDHFSHWFHPPTFTVSLFPELDPQLVWKKEKEGKSTFMSRMLWAFFTVIVAPFFVFFENILGKASVITVYARKSREGS